MLNRHKAIGGYMSKRLSAVRLFILILFSAGINHTLSAQKLLETTILEGRVVDAQTNEGVAYATLMTIRSGDGTITDENGQFSLKITRSTGKIKLSCVGYRTDTIPYRKGGTTPFVIKLKPKIQQLQEIVIKPAKKRYKNKGNPAVELIEKVIAHKKDNHQGNWQYLENTKYEKIIFGLSNYTSKFRPDNTPKSFHFLFNHTDTSSIKGKKLLPLYIQEKLSDNYFCKSPAHEKEVVKATKTVDYGKYFSMEGISVYLKNIYESIDLYENNISFLTNQFVSPIANAAPTFYKYFIMDTVQLENVRCIRLYFSPRNKTDMLFQGDLYITLDSCYAVRQADFTVNRDINLNWVKEANINLTYVKNRKNEWLLESDHVGIDFGLPKTELGVYGQRTTTYNDYKTDTPRDEAFYKKTTIENDSVALHPDSYWLANRPQPLSFPERGIYTMIDSLKQVPTFKRSMDLVYLLLYGYKSVGPFAIGSLYNFVGYNPVEGYRVQFGGKTTSQFNEHFYLSGYGAYGFHDKTWKYSFTGAIGMDSKSIFRFPAHYLKLSYQYDAKTPGNEMSLSQSYNFIAALVWGNYNKFFYNRIFQAEYLHEFKSHFSYTAGFQYIRETPRGMLYFNHSNYSLQTNDKAYLPIAELYGKLRYAPHEKFYQEQMSRFTMPTSYPILELEYRIGNKAFGNSYNYQKIKLSAFKRFKLSVLGYSDVTLEGAKLFGTVPYPLLFIHQATQNYMFDDTKYNMMNFLEFVSDRYASLSIDHNFNGFFLNKIPLFKKLNWREAITCKVLYGDVGTRNNPVYNDQLFLFPENSDGSAATHKLGNTPYVEVSAGIGNILRIFRIDFVKRLTYLNNPDISDFGIRASMKMDF